MNLKQLILVILSMVSLSLFAQDTYYYYKGQRIPLTVNPQKVNVLSLRSYSQSGAAFAPAAVPTGIIVEETMQGNPYNMSVLRETATDGGTLTNYVNATVNNNCNKVLPCYFNQNGKELVASNYFYIKLRKAEDYSLLQEVAEQYDVQIMGSDTYMPLWFTLSITQATMYDTVQLTNLLNELNLFQYVEPNFIMNCLANISWDENVSEQWGLYNAENDSIDINASSAWNYATGRGVKVAVIDTGVEHTHDDLKENMDSLFYDSDFMASSRDVYSYHGTHVAGIIAAERNNGKHIAGVAPDAKIMAISNKLLSSLLIEHNLARCINWAWKNGAEIINCSWGLDAFGSYISDAIDYAIEKGRDGKGCIIVIAVGNDGIPIISYPANYRQEVVAVGAVTSSGTRASFSNYGDALDVVAPGVDVLSTVLNNKIKYEKGTSMAAPHVSGIAALILELNPDLTAQQVRDIIEKSTIKVGNVKYATDSVRPNGTWNQEYGYGLVDALKAVQNTPRKQEDY